MVQLQKTKIGFVYFLQIGDAGPIKIGFTYKSPFSRVKLHQQISPWELRWIGYYIGSLQNEAECHSKFDNARIRAEWFHPVKDLLAFIEEKSPEFNPHETIEKIFQEPSAEIVRNAVKSARKVARAKDWRCTRLENALAKCGLSDLRREFHQWLDHEYIPSPEFVEAALHVAEILRVSSKQLDGQAA
jgi:hypothetical protein